MIEAIGTVMFWMIAAVGACIALFLGCMILIVIIGIPIAIICAIENQIRDTSPDPKKWAKAHGIPPGMTPEQRYQWANRIGPYRNA